MKDLVLVLLLCVVVGVSGRCDYVAPVLLCTDVNITQFVDAYEKHYPQVVQVVSGNLQNFDYNFKDCSRLTSVTLTGVELFRNDVRRSETFSKCPSIRHLDLSNNRLRDFTMLQLPPALNTLNLSRNHLSFPTSPHQYKDKEPRSDEIRNYFRYLRTNINHLHTIDLSHNFLEFFYYNGGKLITLDLSNNPIRSVDLGAPSLMQVNLRNTLLDGGGLSLRPSTFKDGSDGRPRSIDLSHANYKTLDDTFLRNLFALKAKSNLDVNFAGNPWSCSCRMKEARRTLLTFQTTSLNVDWFKDLRCSTPERLNGKRLIDVNEDDLRCDNVIEFGDCCWKVNLGDTDSVSAPCSLSGLPQPDVRCVTKKNMRSVSIYGKTLPRPQNNLQLKFQTSFISRSYFDYNCTAYRRHPAGNLEPVGANLTCRWVYAGEKIRDYAKKFETSDAQGMSSFPWNKFLMLCMICCHILSVIV